MIRFGVLLKIFSIRAILNGTSVFDTSTLYAANLFMRTIALKNANHFETLIKLPSPLMALMKVNTMKRGT
jgi:hypothetical protein